MSTASLLLGIFFSSAGLGFCIYGKRQHAVIPLACGIALMGLPCCISNPVALVSIGALLMLLPWLACYDL